MRWKGMRKEVNEPKLRPNRGIYLKGLIKARNLSREASIISFTFHIYAIES
jgi:hypothetical protein